MKKYQIIYADPPWQYQKPGRKSQRDGMAINHYSTMATDDICKLPISDLAEDTSILFMWATFRKMKEAFKVMEAWGFEYKTLGFSWIKLYPKKLTPAWGNGFYTRQNCEVVLIGTKGSASQLVKRHNIHSVIISPRLGHSAKPDEVRKRIVDLVGDLSRIELFAREKSLGWDSWGNEIQNDIEIN